MSGSKALANRFAQSVWLDIKGQYMQMVSNHYSSKRWSFRFQTRFVESIRPGTIAQSPKIRTSGSSQSLTSIWQSQLVGESPKLVFRGRFLHTTNFSLCGNLSFGVVTLALNMCASASLSYSGLILLMNAIISESIADWGYKEVYNQRVQMH